MIQAIIGHFNDRIDIDHGRAVNYLTSIADDALSYQDVISQIRRHAEEHDQDIESCDFCKELKSCADKIAREMSYRITKVDDSDLAELERMDKILDDSKKSGNLGRMVNRLGSKGKWRLPK